MHPCPWMVRGGLPISSSYLGRQLIFSGYKTLPWPLPTYLLLLCQTYQFLSDPVINLWWQSETCTNIYWTSCFFCFLLVLLFKLLYKITINVWSINLILPAHDFLVYNNNKTQNPIFLSPSSRQRKTRGNLFLSKLRATITKLNKTITVITETGRWVKFISSLRKIKRDYVKYFACECPLRLNV